MFKRNKLHILTYIGIAVLCVASLVWAAETKFFGSVRIDATADSETYQLSVYNSSGTRVFSVDSSGNIYVAGTATVSGAADAMVLTSPNLTFAKSTHTISNSEDWTLSTAEAKTTLLVLASGNAAYTPNIYGPSTSGRLFCIRNASNCSVKILVLGQTGITVASSKTACVFADGTDYRRLTADATH